MANFSNLNRLQVKADATSTYELVNVEGVDGRVPKIHLKHAGETNKAYWGESIKRLTAQRRRNRGAADEDGRQMVVQIKAAREIDREIFPQYVVTGWDDVMGADGPVPYTRADCAEFLKALPDWIFEKVRNHAANVENFLPPSDPTPADIEETAGN